ncbi:hypothetical protein FSP39_012983 [Pinctada imbricata]|uniref:Phosphatidic acid phosphatase type 2/haloperoxidase domain-containing protein n=1 Tax=Pinctada imbricata TaxID=66713 RepID=A0AA89C7H0_PINIB|nr:hypothetical protein FSP39_012983 [Pinctada imbricata]
MVQGSIGYQFKSGTEQREKITSIKAAALPLLLFKAVVTPFHRGFYCDDVTIQYPFKESTVSSAVLYGVGFSLNIVVILIVEFILTQNNIQWCIPGRGNPGKNEDNDNNPMLENRTKHYIFRWFAASFQVLLPFMFGAVMEHVTTDIAKYAVGRLRPHFLDVCKPDKSKYNCSHGYIQQDVCTGDPALIREARLSFPSGHASFSTYTMMFLMLYIQARLRWRTIKLLRPALQLIVFYLAYYTCLSRISDYKHHWSDVLAGSVIGVVSAILTVFKISSLFEESDEQVKYQDQIPNINQQLSLPSTSNGPVRNSNLNENSSDIYKGHSNNNPHVTDDHSKNMYVVNDSYEGWDQGNTRVRLNAHQGPDMMGHTNSAFYSEDLPPGSHSKITTNL